MAISAGSFELIHGNRLELLAEHLAQAVAHDDRDSALASAIVVVPHPDMARWLRLWLADRAGICANVLFPLPAAFAWQVMQAHLGPQSAHSRYSRQTLTWRIFALLPALLQRKEWDLSFASFKQKNTANPVAELHLYRFAARLADLFDQYLVYRRDWLEAWEQGGLLELGASEPMQALLWRRLHTSSASSHQGALLDQLLKESEKFSGMVGELPQRIFCFGISQLAPAYLDILRFIARRHRVALYQLNPSLHYWADLKSERELARLNALRKKYGRADVQHHYEVGHSLLAAWGKPGRDFLQRLHADEPQEELDLFALPAKDTLLHRLQRSVVLIDPQECSTVPAGNDRSLSIHACAGRLREVEALHDALLAHFQADGTLKPRDVVVMAPAIGDYTSAISAVFDGAPLRRRMNYFVADRAHYAQQPIVRSFRQLLDLPNNRFTTNDVLGLLAVPAIAQRFAVSESEREALAHWVESSGVRWGLDGSFRSQLGLGAYSEFSWQLGLQRLFAGYACGEGVAQWENVAPYADVEGQAAQSLGKLQVFLNNLQALNLSLKTKRTVVGWIRLLNSAIEDFFLPAPSDVTGLAAVGDLQRALRSVADSADAADINKTVAFETFNEAFDAQLRDTFSSDFSVGDGVKFCSLSPMRCLPFRVIAILGLNAGTFPAPVDRDSLNLMQAKPRSGDRSHRDNERFLFLETLLSARDALHLSFIATDAQDGQPKHWSTLLDELMEFVARQCFSGNLDSARACLVRRHQLQPFAFDYFSGAESQRSFAAQWIAAAETRPDRAVSRPFMQDFRLQKSPPLEVKLDQLVRFFRNPAKFQLRELLGIELMGDEDESDDVEPFGLVGLDRYAARNYLLASALDEALPLGLSPALRSLGWFPAGTAGDRIYSLERSMIEDFVAVLREYGATDDGIFYDIGIDLNSVHVHGRLTVSRQGLLLHKLGELRAADLLEAWIKHLVLEQIQAGSSRERCLLGLSGDVPKRHCFAPLGGALAGQLLEDLVALFRESHERAIPLFPRTQLAYVSAEVRLAKKGKAADPLRSAEKAWHDDQSYGESRDPYAALLARGREPLIDGEFIDCARRVFLPLLQASP